MHKTTQATIHYNALQHTTLNVKTQYTMQLCMHFIINFLTKYSTVTIKLYYTRQYNSVHCNKPHYTPVDCIMINYTTLHTITHT